MRVTARKNIGREDHLSFVYQVVTGTNILRKEWRKCKKFFHTNEERDNYFNLIVAQASKSN